MSAQPAEPTTTAPAAPATPQAAVTPPASPPAPAAPAEPAKPADNQPPWGDDFDPEKAWTLIQNLKQEAKGKGDAKAQAATEAKKELAQTIGKALGLVEDEPIDPAKLTESLTAAQQEAKRAQVALAVYQNAGQVGDPVALLDSTTFLNSVASVDPSDTAAITAAIEAAVAANPRLGAAPPDPRTPAPNPAQGSSAAGAPDLDAQITAAQKSGDIRQAIHLQNQKLAQQRA